MTAEARQLTTRDALYRKVGWRLMPVLVLCYLAAFIDRTNIGFAKLQFMGELGFTEAMYGFGAGIFYVGYMLFEIPSNLYLARRGVRRTLLRIMLLWGLASAAMMAMHSARDFYVLRALLGAAEAGFFPGVLLYLTYWVPANRRARFTSLFMLSIAVTGVVGSPIAGFVMSALDGAAGLRGWQWLFLLEGLPSCVLGVVAYRYLSDTPETAPWLTARERVEIVSDLASEDRTGQARHSRFSMALLDRRFALLVVMAYALFTSASGIFLWLPTVLRNAGMTSLWQIGLVSMVPFSVGGVAQYLIGRRSDRVLERRWHSIIPALIGAIGWMLLPEVAGNALASIVVMTVVTGGTLGAMATFWTMPSNLLSGTAAAAGIALVSTLGSAGNFISPVVIGWLASLTGSLAAGQYYLALVLLLGAGALIAVGTPKPVTILTPARSEA
jgi:MFS family permease